MKPTQKILLVAVLTSAGALLNAKVFHLRNVVPFVALTGVLGAAAEFIALVLEKRKLVGKVTPLFTETEQQGDDKEGLDKKEQLEGNQELLNKIKNYEDEIITLTKERNKANDELVSCDSDFHETLKYIQQLLGYNKRFSDTEKYKQEVCLRINDLAELLANVGVDVVDYSEDKKEYFDIIPDDQEQKITTIYPAILRKGFLILKGRIIAPR